MEYLTTPCPFILATGARTGSNFLMDLLSSTGMVGRVRERLHKYRHRRLELSDTEVESIMNQICIKSTEHTSASHWGMKVDICEVILFEHYLQIINIKPKDIKWIFLRRHDKAKQALSFIKAAETKQWQLCIGDSAEDFERDKKQIDVDNSRCKDVMLKFFIMEDAWLNFFDLHGIEPYVLYYEDFIDESTWESTVAGIFDFVGVPYELPLDVSSEHVKRHENSAEAVYEELKKLMKYCDPYHYTFFYRKV